MVPQRELDELFPADLSAAPDIDQTNLVKSLQQLHQFRGPRAISPTWLEIWAAPQL